MIRYHARWVLPVGAPPLRDATVVVAGERVAYVGARASAPEGLDVELGDAALLPGLVNAHTHLDLAAFEGTLRGLDFFTWVRTLVRGLTEAMTHDMLADIAHFSVADQLAHGVTTVGHTGPNPGVADAMRALGIRGASYIEIFGPDPAQCGDAMSSLRARVATARSRDTPLVRIGVSPHAPYSVSDDLYRAVAEFARADELPVAVHIAETAAESALVRDGSGPFAGMLRTRGIDVQPRAESPVALLERTGVLRTRPLCIHAVHVDETDVERIADAGASIVHCPRANAWFAPECAPVAGFRARGIAVGIGTDSIANNESVRVLADARAAADYTLSAGERIELATLGGARALGLDAEVGTIARGKQADLTAFAVRDVARCDTDPARYLLDACGADPALVTVVGGVVRARDGRALGADALVLARAAEHCRTVTNWARTARAHWRAP